MCTFGYILGEQSATTVNERANGRALSAKYARSYNYTEGLSHSSFAVVIAYQRLPRTLFVSVAICPTYGASQRPAGYPEHRLPRTIGGCINVKTIASSQKKKRAIISITMWIDREEGGKNA